MGVNQNPLIRSFSYDGRDPEEVFARQRELYGPAQRRTSGFTRDFRCRMLVTQADSVIVNRIAYTSASVVSDQPARDWVTVARISSGRYRLTACGNQATAGPGQMTLFPIATPYVDLTDVRAQLISVRGGAIRRAIAEITDAESPVYPFLSAAPISVAAERLWVATASFAERTLAGPAAGVEGGPLVIDAVTRIVAASMLAVFPNVTTRAGLPPVRDLAAPDAVRRAAAFMDENCHLPISASDIAGAAGLGVRALRLAFRRHRGLTPGAYLRRARLDGARQDLITADRGTGTTVSAIAVRWGFGNPGRFAAAHRAAYGESPAQTLRA